jgi:hypothetical protein
MNSNRRSFMRNTALGGAAFGAAGLMSSRLLAQGTPSDVDILNFALNLEYLEAEFYTYATTGAGITQEGFSITGSGLAGSTTGGSQVNFTDSGVQAIAMEIADDERQHVQLLQGAVASLGGQAVAKPAINLAAAGVGFANQSSFLVLARIFEDIGVTAYAGAAPLIQNNGILGYAARILATEAEHVGSIRSLIARLGIATGTPLDGADVLPPPTGPQYFSLNSSGLPDTRTPGQVLYLAYATASATAGGFFPKGVNGNLNTSAASPAVGDIASISASPNPIMVPAGVVTGIATISWNAGPSSAIQVRVGSPNGAEFAAANGGPGTMQTGNWVENGTVFYLQDVSNGKALTAANTLATTTVTVQQA